MLWYHRQISRYTYIGLLPKTVVDSDSVTVFKTRHRRNFSGVRADAYPYFLKSGGTVPPPILSATKVAFVRIQLRKALFTTFNDGFLSLLYCDCVLQTKVLWPFTRGHLLSGNCAEMPRTPMEELTALPRFPSSIKRPYF